MNTLHTYKASIYAALTVVVILSVYSCRADSGCTADIRTNIGVSFFGAVRDSAKNRFITTVLTDTIMVKGFRQRLYYKRYTTDIDGKVATETFGQPHGIRNTTR